MTHRWNGIAKVTFVVLLFGLAIRMTLWLGLLVVVPGPAKQMDVREVFLILGSCLTGPIGGMFIGLISGLNASTAWLPVAMHMVLGAWVGWFYYRVVYRHTSLGELIVSWTVLVAVYYFLICLPVFVLATLLQPSLLPVALPENFSTMNVVFDVAKALASEALFTYVVSLSILLMFPAKHRAPLWVFNRSVNDNADGVAEHDAVPTLTQSRGRLGLRLMAWFLVLSLLPIAVVGVFVRDNVSSAVILLDASKQQEIARLIALDIQREGVTGAFSAMKQERWITNQSVFLVDSAETCLAGTDTSANGLPLSNAIPERLARSIRTKSLGFVNDAAAGKSIGFARVGSTGKTVVVVQSRTALDHILGQLQQSIYYKLTVSLLFVSLVVGAAIWLLVTRPLKKFMGAAREVGFGNLGITLNPGDMEDEVATLAHVFNEMIDNLRQLHRDMEQEITQRKRAEEIVGERERQFRLLAENSTDMISRHDLDGRYLYVSPACRTLLGYSPEEMLGRSAYEFVHEEDQPALSAHHKHQLSTYATDPVVFRCLRRDGAVVWLESTSRLLLEAETGQPTEIHVSSRDITRRRVAELALKESEVRLRTVVSNVPVVLFAINKEGIFTLSEGLGLRKLGLKPGQIVGASVYDVYKDHPDVIDQVRRALEGETVVSTTLVGAVAFETYYTQTFDDAGGVSGLIGVGTDVTERLQAEEALRESERMYKTLIEQSSDPVYMIQDGRLVFVNHRWEEMFGYSSAEVTSPGFNILSIIAPESRVLVDKRLRSYARRETVPMRYEMKGMKRDGTILELDVSVADIEWKGKPAFQGIYRDITDQKRAEETTRHQQKTESLGILAGGIAHDFNNLLQSILGQTSLALSRLPKDTPAFSNVSKAEQTAKRAAELTRQLLAYSGKGKFNVRPLDLNALIRENLHFLELAIPKGVTLEENLEPSLPYIEADAGQIQQVVMNLIINASEAVGERTGRILLATSVETIPFDAVDNWTRATGTLTPGEFVKLEVVDNGVGMAADTLRKIFDPFFTTKVTGRGLGLSAVIGIVKGHHGGLRVESEAGRGTSFKLVFPVSASRPEAVPTAEKKTGSRRYKGCVLVIDDEEQVREVVSDMLEDAGIETLVAPSGEEGIRTYKLHNDVIGLVLLDLSMPGLGGKETFRLLKQFDPQVKVVLSSGYSETEVTDDLRDLGLAGFIQKPFRYENLKELLSGFLPQDS